MTTNNRTVVRGNRTTNMTSGQVNFTSELPLVGFFGANSSTFFSSLGGVLAKKNC